jgi:hypothetical protein
MCVDGRVDAGSPSCQTWAVLVPRFVVVDADIFSTRGTLVGDIGAAVRDLPFSLDGAVLGLPTGPVWLVHCA